MQMIHFHAGYTANGTPKRVYVLLDKSGHFVGAWEQRFGGLEVLPEEYREAARFCPSFQITAKEYGEQSRRAKLCKGGAA